MFDRRALHAAPLAQCKFSFAINLRLRVSP
ncbi:Uncharacterised protein [Serratia fonticola]|uniref:Uncharacterized protein n=1 Tax=Serratia fonticola TaxID=47917 RepID=A0A4U9U5Z9_SERFO|nr:Uncharacterised protein [Serratia fonticola]